jgi:hypothetical protein
MKNRPLGTLTTTGPPGPKAILDGDLLCTFLTLPYLQQKEIAKSVGSTVDRILDDLVEVKNEINYF